MATTTVAVSVLLVFVGCQLNLVALELLVKDPAGRDYGNAITFLQFVGVSALALVQLVQRTHTEKGVPVRWWPLRLNVGRLSFRYLLILSTTFYLVSVLNNIVFAFDISVPLHAVFRSSSLIVTMIVGRVFRGTRYTLGQVLCAVLVSAGVTGLTIATANQRGGDKAVTAGQPTAEDLYWWWAGIGILAFTTVVSAAMGLLQDAMYQEAQRRLGTQTDLWTESLFFCHALPIPLFVVFGGLTSTPSLGGGLFLQLRTTPPHLYWTIAANVVTQYICVRSVYTLLATTSALTMTLTITLRKFFSLVVSIVSFGHYRDFAWTHYAALVAVVAGGTAYPFVGAKKVKAA